MSTKNVVTVVTKREYTKTKWHRDKDDEGPFIVCPNGQIVRPTSAGVWPVIVANTSGGYTISGGENFHAGHVC